MEEQPEFVKYWPQIGIEIEEGERENYCNTQRAKSQRLLLPSKQTPQEDDHV